MENSQKNDTQSMKEQPWITYKDDDGQIKSAPLPIFLKIAKKRGWKKVPTDWIK